MVATPSKVECIGIMRSKLISTNSTSMWFCYSHFLLECWLILLLYQCFGYLFYIEWLGSSIFPCVVYRGIFLKVTFVWWIFQVVGCVEEAEPFSSKLTGIAIPYHNYLISFTQDWGIVIHEYLIAVAQIRRSPGGVNWSIGVGTHDAGWLLVLCTRDVRVTSWHHWRMACLTRLR